MGRRGGMAAVKGREIRLSTDTGFLKLIAMVSMVMDHAGKMFFPQLGWMRIVGRLAFPIYAYCVAAGCMYTRNPLRYALRVLGLALISQPVYCLALAHVSGTMNAAVQNGITLTGAVTWFVESMKNANILFTLLAGILLIGSLREKKYILAGLMTWLVWYTDSYINYGWEGVALMVLFYAFIDQPLTSLCWVGGFMLWWAGRSGGTYQLFMFRYSIQIFALLALPLIYIPTKTGARLPKWAFYLFYPLHLAVIYLLLQMGV